MYLKIDLLLTWVVVTGTVSVGHWSRKLVVRGSQKPTKRDGVMLIMSLVRGLMSIGS